MSVSTYRELLDHEGHRIECVSYGYPQDLPMNVSIECETCNVVLLGFDREVK